VGRHRSIGRFAAAVLSVTSILAGSCNNPRSPSQHAIAASNDISQVSQELVGKRIKVRGQFSLRCKAPECIVLDHGQTVYLVSTKADPTVGDSYSSKSPHSDMDGKLVTVTGTLRFYRDSSATTKNLAEQRPPDHFYFDGENLEVRLADH
jgi:hypothetical protein